MPATAPISRGARRASRELEWAQRSPASGHHSSAISHQRSQRKAAWHPLGVLSQLGGFSSPPGKLVSPPAPPIVHLAIHVLRMRRHSLSPVGPASASPAAGSSPVCVEAWAEARSVVCASASRNAFSLMKAAILCAKCVRACSALCEPPAPVHAASWNFASYSRGRRRCGRKGESREVVEGKGRCQFQSRCT